MKYSVGRSSEINIAKGFDQQKENERELCSMVRTRLRILVETTRRRGGGP